MNRRTGIIASILLIATFSVAASVRAALPSPSALGVQVTSTDIEVLDVIPALTYQPGGSYSQIATGIGVNVNLFPGATANASAGFSFTPVRGFSQVNSVLLTLVYFGGTGGYTGFGVELNAHAPVTIPAPTIENTVVGSLRGDDLRVGANTINIGLVPQGQGTAALTYVYEVRLTIEYTFFG